MERSEQITIIKAYADWTSKQASQRHHHIQTKRSLCVCVRIVNHRNHRRSSMCALRFYVGERERIVFAKRTECHCIVPFGEVIVVQNSIYSRLWMRMCAFTNTIGRRKRNDSANEWAHRKYLLKQNKKTKTSTHDNSSERCLFEDSGFDWSQWFNGNAAIHA